MSKLYIAGIGPGGAEYMTRQAYDAVREAELIVGYTLYTDLLRKEFPDKTYYSTPMRRERERCLYALRAAEAGTGTVLVCSGDSGVYGMASLTLELAEETGSDAEIEIIPGITAALSAGALAGAPVSGDFAAVSLSDLLTPWSVIEKRLESAAAGDFVIALYNPGSRKRADHLKKACRIIGKFRDSGTVCAVVSQAGREGESIRFLSLKELEEVRADMFMTILVGNSSTRKVRTAGGVKMVTPRGYLTQEENPERKTGGQRKSEEEQKQDRLVIFGGTTEGRQLAEFACEKGVPVCVCVATSYGGQLLRPHPLLEVNSGGMEEEEIGEFLSDPGILAVLDATHPYAPEITEKISAACRRTKKKYIRVQREILTESGFSSCAEREEGKQKGQKRPDADDWKRIAAEKDVIPVGSAEEAACILDGCQGRALITTGSKDVSAYMKVRDAEERLTFRVLPSREALTACTEAGVPGKNLICMQGPFSAEMNAAMLKECGADYLVTKISGKNGGFEEKIRAARQAGASVIAVMPPVSSKGISMREACDFIAETAALSAVKDERTEVTVAGIGPGDPGMMTDSLHRAFLRADIVIGAKRVTDDLRKSVEKTGAFLPKMYIDEYRADRIAAFLEEDTASHPGRSYLVTVSGDSGFFSAAAGIRRALEKRNIRPEILPGISSLSCLCAKTGVSWEDAVCISAHGRETGIASCVRRHEKTFVLTGGNASEILQRLSEYGLGDVRVIAGERLSYPDELITEGTVDEMADCGFSALTSLLLINGRPDSGPVCGIADSSFLRGNVPMTKREIRAQAISLLHLRDDSIVWDIGAGTGSVTVEAALNAWRGRIFAVERKEEALSLIGKNCRKFSADNVEIIPGEATEALKDLPLPDAVFIGGAGGRLEEILESLKAAAENVGGSGSCGSSGEEERKEHTIRVVMTAVTMETIGSGASLMRKCGFDDVEEVQISAARSEAAGRYHLLRAQSPVFLISGKLCWGKAVTEECESETGADRHIPE